MKGNNMNIQPYLCFEGRTEEAIEFYQKAVGADCPRLMRWAEAPEGPCGGGPPPPDNKIMHADLMFGSSMVHFSDGMCSGQANFAGIHLSLNLKTESQARDCYSALTDGGQPFLELHETFFSPLFGMLKDRFGVTWSVMVESEGQD
jgi:PhnB protein